MHYWNHWEKGKLHCQKLAGIFYDVANPSPLGISSFVVLELLTSGPLYPQILQANANDIDYAPDLKLKRHHAFES